jgi:hypothetical protein
LPCSPALPSLFVGALVWQVYVRERGEFWSGMFVILGKLYEVFCNMYVVEYIYIMYRVMDVTENIDWLFALRHASYLAS